MIMSKDYPCVYWNNGKCKKFSDDDITSWCVWNPCDSQTPSNADRIRSMSDEELDCFLHKVTYGMDECPYEYGSEKALEWLQQPAEETER